MNWILFSLLAALFQTIRTALQKSLKKKLPDNLINWARYAFGLPFIIIYVIFLLAIGHNLPQINGQFLIFCFFAGIFQIVGTASLLNLFGKRNFTIGTIYAKTETIQTAFFGLILFGESISTAGFIGLIIGLFGVLLISLIEDKITLKNLIKGFLNKTAIIGIFIGFSFAMSGLLVREATLTLNENYLINSAFTLLIIITMQFVILGSKIMIHNKNELKKITKYWKSVTLIGLTSALGSIGWFSAFALTSATYVKIIGQAELLFSLIITHHFFREKINRIEIWGMALIMLSIILLIIFQ